MLSDGLVAYVEMTGNDSNGFAGNPAKPYQTIDAALQSAATIAMIGDGVFDKTQDYRFTQRATGMMKLVRAKKGALSFVSPATIWPIRCVPNYDCPSRRTSVLGCTPASYCTPDQYYRHIWIPDTTPYFASATRNIADVNTAVTALQKADYGWTYDGTQSNKVLYVALPDVKANPARLMALYYNSSGNDRVFIQVTNLAFDGIYFDGQHIWAIEYNNNGTYIHSSIGYRTARTFLHLIMALQADSDTMAILENVRIHGSTNDGLNADSTRNGSGAAAKAMLIGCHITESGDVATYGTGKTSNCQTISSHSGYLAAFSCLLEKNWCQEVADTSSDTGTNSSWYVSCIARNGDTRLGSGRTGFGFYGVNRKAYLDTGVGLNECTTPLRIEGGASAKIFNCTFDAPESIDPPSVASTTYVPSAP